MTSEDTKPGDAVVDNDGKVITRKELIEWMENLQRDFGNVQKALEAMNSRPPSPDNSEAIKMLTSKLDELKADQAEVRKLLATPIKPAEPTAEQDQPLKPPKSRVRKSAEDADQDQPKPRTQRSNKAWV